ncbi:hypothetical protein SLEP1_g25632 [Rubroshorea leprosula]|uniref:Uncharacterized protein n=1 Tax=Rubroshorea leprosula TaxID=152421 RepID=A0AAV5JMM8_9ROSI|nr:hypothetical protein SLEP1_g25632 [Rubroshorea leprosula]
MVGDEEGGEISTEICWKVHPQAKEEQNPKTQPTLLAEAAGSWLSFFLQEDLKKIMCA